MTRYPEPSDSLNTTADHRADARALPERERYEDLDAPTPAEAERDER